MNSRTAVSDAEELFIIWRENFGEIFDFFEIRPARHTPPNFLLPQTLDAKNLVSFLRRSPTMGDKFWYPQTKVLNGGAGRAQKPKFQIRVQRAASLS